MQQIKTYITIRNIDQITRFEAVGDEQIVGSYQCSEALADLVSKLIKAAQAGRIGVISGPRGVGKSHMLALIRSLIEWPELIGQVEHLVAQSRLQKIFGDKPPYRNVINIYFNSEIDPLTIIKQADEQIEEASKSVNSTVIFIDGISPLLRGSGRLVFRQWLHRLASESLDDKWIFFTLYEELLPALPLDEERFEIVNIPMQTMSEVIDQFICSKTRQQRQSITELYGQLRKQMPHFHSSLSEFVELYPLHPAILKLAPVMREHSRSFSLFGFFFGVAPRAVLRRDFNLICLTELFETFEYDLRRNSKLKELFASYDFLAENFIRGLQPGREFYGKMLLRAITLLSITGNCFSIMDIADSVMLYEDSPPALFLQLLKNVINFMATAAGNRMEVIEKNGEPHYKLRLTADPIEEAVKQVPDDDIRLVLLLLDNGLQCYDDWPLGFEDNDFKRRVETDLLWRGTARKGIVKFGGCSELSPDSKWEWQLTILSPLPSRDFYDAARPGEDLRYWHPAELSSEELLLLKRLLVLREQGAEFYKPEELAHETAYLSHQVAEVFSRCYIELGCISDSPQSSAGTFSLQEKSFVGTLCNIFNSPLQSRYPSHPIFRRALNEKALRELARGLFFTSEWSRPELKSCLELFALPLNIVKRAGDGFEFLQKDDLHDDSPYKRLLLLLEISGGIGISREQINEMFGTEPFGLQPPVLFLLLLGAAASGNTVLTNETGEVILTQEGVRKGADIVNYSRAIMSAGLERADALPVSSSAEYEEEHEDPDSEFSRDKAGFQTMMSEAMNSAPVSEELSAHDEALLEAAQSMGIVKENASEGPVTEILSALDSFSVETSDKQPLAVVEDAQDDALKAHDRQYDNVDLEPITGGYYETLPPTEEAAKAWEDASKAWNEELAKNKAGVDQLISITGDTVETPMDDDAEPLVEEGVLVQNEDLASVNADPPQSNSERSILSETSMFGVKSNGSRLVIARKLTDERSANKELIVLYDKFVETCRKYSGPDPIPEFEMFKSQILKRALKIGRLAHSREVWCRIEVGGGVAQIHCQVERASVFQKRLPKRRVF